MSTPSLVGQILAATYRVDGLLGQGGMGAVYVASHLRLPTRVAIKLLHGEAAGNPEIFARFRREAEIASGLRHPNIVQVFDFNHLEDGTPYLIMEFLEGEDLAARLRQRGRLSYPETAALCQAVGSGLSAAHRRDVVHRDLKPQNIFLARHEQGDGVVEIPKIVDFGISKIRHAVVDSLKTRDQQLLGTPNYMSPEQARGLNSEVDHRTDQWALAAILYQCLTGRVAFTGDSLAAIIYQVVLAEPPPLRSLATDAPVCAEDAVLRALSKERDRRFPTIMEFVRAFCGLGVQPSAGTPAPGGYAQADHPLAATPGAQTALPTPQPSSGSAGLGGPSASWPSQNGRGSLTGAGGQLAPPPVGRRRLALGLGLSGGLLCVGALLALKLAGPGPERWPRGDAGSGPSSERVADPGSTPRPEAPDLGPAVPAAATPDLAPAAATREVPAQVRERPRRERERERDRRPRPPHSDADDVDISGIR